MGCSLARLSLISFQLLPVRCLQTPAPRQPACHYLSLGAVLGGGMECLSSQSYPRGPQASCVALQHWESLLRSRALGTKGVQGTGPGPLVSEGPHRNRTRTRACALTGNGTDDIPLCRPPPSQPSDNGQGNSPLITKIILIISLSPLSLCCLRFLAPPSERQGLRTPQLCGGRGCTEGGEPARKLWAIHRAAGHPGSRELGLRGPPAWTSSVCLLRKPVLVWNPGNELEFQGSLPLFSFVYFPPKHYKP